MVSYPVHYCYTVSVTYTLSLSQCNNSVKVLIYVEGTCYFADLTSMNTLTNRVLPVVVVMFVRKLVVVLIVLMLVTCFCWCDLKIT